MSARSRIFTGAVAASLLVITACGGSDGGGGDDGGNGSGVETVNLRITTSLGGPASPLTRPAEEWLKAVEEESGGAITHEFFYTNSIVPPAEIGEALADSVVDIAMFVPAYTPATYPIDNWIADIAFLGDPGPPATALIQPAAVLDWWHSNQEVIESDFVANGVRPLTPSFTASVSYDLICNSPVTTPEEAAGKQVRTGGAAWAKGVEAMGMTSVSLPGAEMYEALQRGVVDCVNTSIDNIVSSDLAGAAKHYTQIGLPMFTSWGLFFSEQTWQSLSEEQQDVLWGQLPVYMETFITEGLEIRRDFLRDAPAEQGVELHQPGEALREVLDSYQEETLANAVDTAPDSVSDPEALVASFQEVHDKWEGIVTEELGVGAFDSWEEWAASDEADEVDVSKFVERVYAEVLEPNQP